jgi:hypothetical protein
MNSATLYGIKQTLDTIDEILWERDGDITDEEVASIIDAWLSEARGDLTGKVDNYAGKIRALEARAAARKNEAERIAALATTDTNLATRLKERLRAFFESEGLDRFETPRFRFVIANNGGRVPVTLDTSPENLPEGFRRVVFLPDTDAIRAALEAGETVPGATLAPRGRHLRIK